jgi:hypothetical protein
MTEKRFLQLLVLLPVLAPVISIPLFIVPFLSWTPVIFYFALLDGWPQYLVFCIIVIPIVAIIQSTKNIVNFIFLAP